MEAGDFVLLHAGGCLIETPPLSMPDRPPHAVWRWVATLWRDPDQPDGWNALVWDTAARGWWLPSTVMLGDVVEFGVCTLDDHGTQDHVTRWWGWIQRVTHHAIVVVGPFDHPMRAIESARPTVDEFRLAQLPAPSGSDHLSTVGELER
jgi:hypothetical protein